MRFKIWPAWMPLMAALTAGMWVDVGACANPEDAPCKLDSDCVGGLLCGPEGLCATPSTVRALNAKPNRSSTGYICPPSHLPDDGCQEPSGVFEPGPPCREPTQKKTVTAIVIAESGHGLAEAAKTGNLHIADAIATGKLKIELWVDGLLIDDCAPELAWVVAPEHRRADCTALHTDTFPFMLPGLGADTDTVPLAIIHDASLCLETNVLTGWVHKDEVLASLPGLGTIADSMVELDLDIDGDGAPDKASVILTFAFEDE